jgi:putative transposase
MKSYRSVFSIERMAAVLYVSRSGYYAWLSRPESRRKRRQRALDSRVRVCFRTSQDRSGSPKIYHALKQQGFACCRASVARSMRRQGLRSKTRPRFVVTTDSKHMLHVAPNLLRQKFNVDRPNKVWVSDITYLWSHTRWLYLAVVIDLYSRRVIGWSLSKDLGHQGALSALESAIHTRKPDPGLVIHKDRGTQFCSHGYQRAVQEFEIIHSMSRQGNCWDNAVAESFFRTLKTEWAYHIRLKDFDHTRHELFEYIEAFYNNKRLHQTLDYCSPVTFEKQKN